jgi:hypothetical protein
LTGLQFFRIKFFECVFISQIQKIAFLWSRMEKNAKTKGRFSMRFDYESDVAGWWMRIVAKVRLEYNWSKDVCKRVEDDEKLGTFCN